MYKSHKLISVIQQKDLTRHAVKSDEPINKTQKNVKLKYCKVLDVTSGLHSSKTWTMRVINRSRLQATEMSLVMLTAGVTEGYNKKWRH
jgi:hypothetical protein